MLDKTDLEIISLLKENALMQLKDIGEKVHLTGQAVSNRIQRIEALGIIKGYTVRLDEEKLGRNISAYVTVFMKTTDHASFQKFVNESEAVFEAHRISGNGCYMLKICVSTQTELNNFLDSILEYGNYAVNLSIGKVK